MENLSHTRNSILFLHLATSLGDFIGSSVTWQVMELLNKCWFDMVKTGIMLPRKFLVTQNSSILVRGSEILTGHIAAFFLLIYVTLQRIQSCISRWTLVLSTSQPLLQWPCTHKFIKYWQQTYIFISVWKMNKLICWGIYMTLIGTYLWAPDPHNFKCGL